MPDPPSLDDRSFRARLGAASSSSTTTARSLQMVVLRVHNTSYWVVNTLLDTLSNETMLAIAKGLKPLASGEVESGAWQG